MPRAIHPDLADCLRRANPYTRYRIEVSEPDEADILRRVDEFLGTPPLVGAMVPANSLSTDARGSLILSPTTAALASFTGVGGSYDLNGEDPTRRVKGASWTMDPAFTSAKLKSFTATVERLQIAAGIYHARDFELQVFRVTKTPGQRQKVDPTNPNKYTYTDWTEYTFTPLLAPAAVIKAANIGWVNQGAGVQRVTLNFDLSNYALLLDNTPSQAAAPDQAGELPRYYFRVQVLNHPSGTGFFRWLLDTVAARTIAGIGTFQRTWWARNTDKDQWVETLYNDVPAMAVNVETYPASGQAVYAVNMPGLPDTARGSVGRAQFDRFVPPGTSAELGISVSGSGGPFSPVKHGSIVSGRQNLAPRSHNPALAPWATTALTAGAVGMDGLAGTATTLTDNSAAAFLTAALNVNISAAVTRVMATWWILRDADISRFPQLSLSTAGGTVGQRRIHLNTATGAFSTVNTTGQGLVNGFTEVVPEFWGGRWWWKCTVAYDALNNTSMGTTIYAAARDAGGAEVVTAQGSVTLGNLHLEVGVTSPPDGPIFTDAAAVTFAAQQAYHARVTLATDASTRLTPAVAALGLEFRIPVDVSVEGIPALPAREVSLPWMAAAIPEGSLTIVRTGIRDYLDKASNLGSTAPTSKLEADIWLASDHPSVTRDKWLHLERMAVSNRIPGPTSERLTLLSFASKLKQKVPAQQETMNSVYSVLASTVNYVQTTVAMVGTTVGGNEYDGKAYYMRVRSTSSPNWRAGDVAVIQGNTGQSQLDFIPALPAALNAGDVIEVHSGIFNTTPVSWNNADPADIWWEILTTHLGIAPERIGSGYLPRGGRPPKVTDIAPGDATTQAKRKVTMKLAEQEEADTLLDQLSIIMGGATLEIEGQICFVQMLPLRGADGTVTVPLGPPSLIMDVRDYANLQTPPGLEDRATVMRATYGVPLTAAAPDTYPAQSTMAVDQDALLWLTKQDLEEQGSTELPQKVSRWLYNTSDGGLYLAAAITTTYVRALSTGLRVFPFSAAEKQPQLVPGDTLLLLTDQYTDYDPSTQTQIRGPVAIRGVVVRAADEGHSLSIFVPGLTDNVSVQGGGASALIGLGPPPAPPILSASFTSSGELIINSTGDETTTSQKIAFSAIGMPTDADVRAGPPGAGRSFTGIATGVSYTPGQTAYIAAFAYSATGVESLKGTIQVTREGAGAPTPPQAYIDQIASGATTETLRFSALIGAGGTAPMTWRWRTVNSATGAGAWTAWTADSGGTALPQDAVITREMKWLKNVEFQVRDASLLTSEVARYGVEPRIPALDIGGGTYHGYFDETQNTNSGFRVFNRGRDTPVDIVETVTQKFIDGGALDGSRRPISVYRSGAYEPTPNLFKRGSNDAGDVLPSAARDFVAPAYVDASKRITNVFRTATQEPVTNLFKRGSDLATDVVTTSARTFVDPSTATQVDASGRIVGVYRLGVIEPVNNLVKYGDNINIGLLTVTGNAGLPASTGSSVYIASGYASPVVGRIFVGDGSGWALVLSARASSVTTDLYSFYDTGMFALFGLIPRKIVLYGSPTNVLQIGFGDSSVAGALGTIYSSGAAFHAYNAYQPTYNADSWVQSLASVASAMAQVDSGGWQLFTAIAGKATAGRASLLGQSGCLHRFGR
jgi:hypothetical protein